MRFSIGLTASAVEDLDYYRKSERKLITDAIHEFLADDADIESKRRKQLRPNPLGRWELRIADYRVFNDIEESDRVIVGAVGHKEHNDLFIRGIKVET